MWEAIRSNRRRSAVLFIGMGFCLILLGYFIGQAFYPPDGGTSGIILAFIIWFVLSLVSYSSGDSIVLAISNARPVTHDLHPRLFNIVEEMKIAANLPYMPKIYIIDEAAMNAFATGIKKKNCAVAVTAGLLSKLNRDELQGVVAHEMSHILNRDVQFVTFAGIMLGSIALISEIFLRSLRYPSGSSRRYRSGGRGGGQGYAIILLVAIILAILAPIMARLLYLAISRRREYLADASAARLTRYPEGLASALEKLSMSTYDLRSANRVTAPMFIVNPLKKKDMALLDLTSTHPPISERIRVLRKMMGGASYIDYQKAFSEVKGKPSAIIPESGMRESEAIPIRKPALEEAKPSQKDAARDLGDLMRAVNRYAFLVCVCGLKIKVPPDFKKPEINCPRCKRHIEIPLEGLAAMQAAIGVSAVPKAKEVEVKAEDKGPLTYIRKTKGWETFACSCGRLLQLSPSFIGDHVGCSICGKTIIIK